MDNHTLLQEKEKIEQILNDTQHQQEKKQFETICLFTLKPLHDYLLQLFNIDMTEFFSIPIKTSIIDISFKNIQYQLYLDVVQPDYQLNLDPIDNEDVKAKIIEHCTFLVNGFKFVFDNFKTKITNGNEKKLENYTINLDTNSTIFINSNDSKRIGLIFKSV